MVSRQQPQPLTLTTILLSALVLAQCVSPVTSFLASAGTTASVSSACATGSTSLRSTAEKESSTNTDDLLKPSYEIEPIPIRIGHGFDIHRMVPLEEAGQPVVIGGVEIPHKDLKVRTETEASTNGIWRDR